MRISWFIFILIGLFVLEMMGPVQQFVIMPFTAGVAAVSAGLTQLFDSNVLASGIIMRNMNNGAAVSIQPGCNGVEAMIILAAAILAFSTSWKSKLYGLVFGFFAIQGMNIVRIISLFYLLQWDKGWFEVAHLYLWQALIILDAFIVFVIWVRMLSGEEPIHEQSRN